MLRIFSAFDFSETVLPINAWKDLSSFDCHRGLLMTGEIAARREKHDLKMRFEKYVNAKDFSENDKKFIRS